MGLKEFGELLFGGKPLYTKGGMARGVIVILVATFLALEALLALGAQIPYQNLVYGYFWAILFTPSVLFIVGVVLFRSFLKDRLSTKSRVIFAFNLENVEDRDDAEIGYDSLLKLIENKALLLGLGNLLEIEKKYTDISFKDFKAAENKTSIGSNGATVLMWGYASKIGQSPSGLYLVLP